MTAPIDVFALTPKGEGTWLGCAENLPKALDVAIEHGDGWYMVFVQKTSEKIFYKVTAGLVAPV